MRLMVFFPKIYAPDEVITRVEGFSPRLASWNSKDHPDQIRLRTYLDDLRRRVGNLPSNTNSFIRLCVDVVDERKLTRHHDVENYLTPLFGSKWFDHRQFPLVLGSKHVGAGSSLTIGTVTETETESFDAEWQHLSLNAGKSPTTKEWKQRINEFVENARPTQIENDRHIEFHMAFRCATRRNWVWLWKPAGDALSPILGFDGQNKYNPNDDRITSIALHRIDDDSLRNDVHVGIWWKPVPDDA